MGVLSTYVVIYHWLFTTPGYIAGTQQIFSNKYINKDSSKFNKYMQKLEIDYGVKYKTYIWRTDFKFGGTFKGQISLHF